MKNATRLVPITPRTDLQKFCVPQRTCEGKRAKVISYGCALYPHTFTHDNALEAHILAYISNACLRAPSDEVSETMKSQQTTQQIVSWYRFHHTTTQSRCNIVTHRWTELHHREFRIHIGAIKQNMTKNAIGDIYEMYELTEKVRGGLKHRDGSSLTLTVIVCHDDWKMNHFQKPN